MKDTSGDEADNMDETIVPVDYQQAGQLTDDEVLKEVCAQRSEMVTSTHLFFLWLSLL